MLFGTGIERNASNTFYFATISSHIVAVWSWGQDHSALKNTLNFFEWANFKEEKNE